MNDNDKNLESPKKDDKINEPTNQIDNKIEKEKEKISQFKEGENIIQNTTENPPKEKDTLEKPKDLRLQQSNSEQLTGKYTPLNQDSKPYNYKKIKDRKFQNSIDQNIQNNNYINTENTQKNNMNNEKNNDIKRVNYIKQNNYTTQSPVFSYFNDSQKYLSEQYGQNIIKKSLNQINKMSLIKDNNLINNNSTPIEDIEENNISPKTETPNYNDFNFFNNNNNTGTNNINTNANNNYQNSPDAMKGDNSLFNNLMQNTNNNQNINSISSNHYSLEYNSPLNYNFNNLQKDLLFDTSDSPSTPIVDINSYQNTNNNPDNINQFNMNIQNPQYNNMNNFNNDFILNNNQNNMNNNLFNNNLIEKVNTQNNISDKINLLNQLKQLQYINNNNLALKMNPNPLINNKTNQNQSLNLNQINNNFLNNYLKQ